MRKNSKRALIVSALSLLLCVSMLVGTTFAWFTDNASTNVNTIEAGTLDIDIVDKNGNSLAGKPMSFEDKDENALWEPGCTYKLSEVKLVNKGNLWLKFKLTINGITGKDAKLAEVIEVFNGEYSAEKTSVKDGGNYLGTLAELMADPDGAAHGTLAPATDENIPTKSDAYQLTLHMMESAGNAYQGLKLDKISFTVQATQHTYEKDSNDDKYDANAEYAAYEPKVYNSGSHTLNLENKTIEASGENGAIWANGKVDLTINGNGNVVATLGADHSTMAVWAGRASGEGAYTSGQAPTVTINGGTYTHADDVYAYNDEHNDLIYASQGGKIVINGGTFKCSTPKWTLNCRDNSGSTITVNGGEFFEFNPQVVANATGAQPNNYVGANEIVLGTDKTVRSEVRSDGTWYIVE